MRNTAQKPIVLVFSNAYFPFIGGAEVAIQEVARRLKNQFEFCIIASRMDRNLPKMEVREEGRVVRVGFGNRLDKYFLPIFGIFRIFSDFGFRISDLQRPALLWGMDLSAGSLCAAILKFFLPHVPFIFTIQYGYGDKRIRSGRFGFIALALRFILRQADYVTAISTYLMKLCEEYGYIGELAIIHNGVDLHKFQITNSKLQTNSKIQNTKTIITVSRLVPKNGVDVLIKAFAELKIQLPAPNLQLHIVGEGPERKNLEFQVSSCKLQDSVKFLGSVPYDELPKYLAEADVFVRPSRSEGMGNAFVEALAAGVPIIGTPVGGISDIIRDPSTGSGQATGLFAKVDDPKDLAEKIKILLEDKKLAARIVEQGQTMVAERFSWDTIANSYELIFSKKLAVSKKVLIATGLFPPDVGGPATYSKILLDELPKQSLGVRVLSFGSVMYLPKVIRHIAYGLKLIAYGRNADTIFAQDPVSVGFPAAIAAKILRKKFLLKIVGDYAWEQGVQRLGVKEVLDDFLKNKYGWKVEVLRKIQKFVTSRAEKIIVPSEYLKMMVEKWGARSEKIQVIYNAFDFPRAAESLSTKKLLRAKLCLDGKVLVSAGRLVPWKGFDALIEIMPDLVKEFSDLKLVIIGDGPERKKLNALTVGIDAPGASIGGESPIIFTGNLSRKKVLEYLTAADVFVLNTAYEGFSHQILEAMSLGIPVVITNAGGNPELIKDGESGFLVKFNDKKALTARILKLLSDSDLANTFSENAKQKAQEFSLERMIGETTKLIRDL